jgi:hypothetical protein
MANIPDGYVLVKNESTIGKGIVQSSPTVVACGSTAAISSPQSKENLAARTHLSAGMLGMSGNGGGKGSRRNAKKQSKGQVLAADGANIAKFYNLVAGRPYPSFSRLAQEIRVVDTFYTGAFLQTSTTVPVGAAAYFTLNNFTNATAYENVFDQYKISQIEVWLDLNGNQDAVLGELVTAVDLDDVVAPTGPTAIGDKQGALVGNGSAGRYHCFRPHVAVAEYSGTFASYGNVPSTWIDTASGNVQHYGFKVATAAYGNVAVYNLTVRAVIDFRAPGL